MSRTRLRGCCLYRRMMVSRWSAHSFADGPCSVRGFHSGHWHAGPGPGPGPGPGAAGPSGNAMATERGTAPSRGAVDTAARFSWEIIADDAPDGSVCLVIIAAAAAVQSAERRAQRGPGSGRRWPPERRVGCVLQVERVLPGAGAGAGKLRGGEKKKKNKNWQRSGILRLTIPRRWHLPH